MSVPKEIGHIVLNVTDVERSTRFYRDVVGFQVSRYRPDGTGAFLTCGVVHHNLALFKAPAGARPAEKGAIGLNHFAFKVESYQALQAAHKRLVEARATIDHIVDHGMSGSDTVQKVRQRSARKVCAASSIEGLIPSTTPMRTRKAMGVKASTCASQTPGRP